MPGLEDEVAFISGVNADGTVAATSYWTWHYDTPATFSSTSSDAAKWRANSSSGVAGTAGGVLKYYFHPNLATAADDWTVDERKAIGAALALWSMAANISFELTTDPGEAQLTFQRIKAGFGEPVGSASLGYAPVSGGQGTIGGTQLLEFQNVTISLDTRWAGVGPITSIDGNPNTLTDFGGQVWHTLGHEIGHALGLGHGGPYNSLPAAQFSPYDVLPQTAMSYLQPENWSDPYYFQYGSYSYWGTTPRPPGTENLAGSFLFYRAPTTWMPVDILAIQRLYGASPTAPSGNVIFGFNTNLNGDIAPFFDFTKNTKPVMTLLAGGANNTLDARFFSDAATVNLAPGSFSSLAGLTNNIAIAYGTAIDRLFTGAGADKVLANHNGNRIDTGAGDDEIVGGDGNDTLTGGSGTNLIYGGRGIDTAVYSLARADYSVVQNANGSVQVTSLNSSLAVNDTLTAVEFLSFSDTQIAINSAGNAVLGGAGDDTLMASNALNVIDGGSGYNIASYANSGAAVYASLEDNRVTGIASGANSGFLRDIQALTGSAFDDVLRGARSSGTTLRGGGGNDRLIGGYGNDILDGGDGWDTASYEGSLQFAPSINLEAGTSQGFTFGNDTLVNIENVLINSYYGSITVTGSAGENNILVFAPESMATVDAKDGNDRLYVTGLGANSVLDGGAGLNMVKFSRFNATYSMHQTFQPGVAGALPEGITYRNFQYFQLEGRSGDDNVTFIHPLAGRSFQNGFDGPLVSSFIGGGGTNTLTLDLSNFHETLFMEARHEHVIVSTGASSGNVFDLAEVQKLFVVGGSANDQMVGTLGDDMLEGAAGDDRIDGRTGRDVASYAGAGSAVRVDLALTAAQDTGGAGRDELVAIEGLAGSAFDDTLRGAKGDDTLQGGGGNDTLFGGAGSNTIDGGQGADIAIYTGLRASFTIARIGRTTAYRVAGNGISDTVSGIETLQFGDGQVSLAGLRPDTRQDFDGDFQADLLWQRDDGQALLWRMNGLAAPILSSAGGNPGPSWHAMLSGDFNGDGKSDLFWRDDYGQLAIWFMNGSTVTGGDRVTATAGTSAHVVASGDFNGDGKSDLLWQDDNGQASVWLMDGTTILAQANVGSNPGTSWRVRSAGDFNGDGKADILWHGQNGQAAVWLMDGTTLAGGEQLNKNWGPSYRFIATGDFDGNGKSDILWQHKNGQAAIWALDGAAVLTSQEVGSNPGLSWRLKGAPDVNGDGRSDMIWQRDDGQMAAWLMNGAVIIGGDQIGPNPGLAQNLIFDSRDRATNPGNDFNGDSRSEIVWQHDGGQARIWRLDGFNVAVSADIGSNPGPNWNLVASGDFQGDGRSDLLWQDNLGQLAIWRMSDMTILDGARIERSVEPGMRAITTGDFNGDGRADILFQKVSGQAHVWLMNGTTVLATSDIGSNPGTSWKIKGAGDLNGDHRDDILWQNTARDNAVWLIDGFNIIGSDRVFAGIGRSDIAGVGDFNADGKDDIMWQRDEGWVGFQLMDGTYGWSSLGLADNLGAEWRVSVAGDLDADGIADLLWRNRDTGEVAAWIMTTGIENVPTAGERLTPVLGTSWNILAAG